MKKLFLTIVSISCLLFAFSQDVTKKKTREVGVAFSNLNNFGVTYRVGKEKALWRFNFASLSGEVVRPNDPNDPDRKFGGAGISVNAGHEWRKAIGEIFELRYGLDFGYAFRRGFIHTTDFGGTRIIESTDRHTPNIQFVFGFNFVVKEHFVFGAEVLPRVAFNQNIDKVRFPEEDFDSVKTKSNSVSYGLDNNSARLSFAYRF